MKKKGFTLIELLAVIVVLAVIALIATPIVLNLVKTAKIGAAEQSVTGYVKSIENTIIKDMINNKEVSDGNYKYNSIEADISGKRPTSGKYIVKNGKVESGNFCVDGYYIEYKNGQSKYNKDKECGNVGPTKVEPTSTDTHKGIVYLDPTGLSKKCNESNSKSETGTKTGCMKWYIYSEDNNSYTMILDHNTSVKASWNSRSTQLKNDTDGWDKSLKARLITANEIATITDNKSWRISDMWYYFDSKNFTVHADSTNKSKYAWLFEYTNGCKEYGCNIEDSSAYGYWTSTPVVAGRTNYVWDVFKYGNLGNCNVSITNDGIRPVITVSKNNKDKESNNSNPSVSSGVTKVEPTSKDTHKGIVYLDPTNLENSCNASNSIGTWKRTGCMKWYIYAEDDNSYTMILDHNTSNGLAYNSTNNNSEMEDVKTYLKNDTKSWDKSLNARLITANEVAKITGNTSFDEKTATDNKWFYLDSNNQTQVANKTNKSKYAWLYDYTSGCEGYGCNIEDSAWGYWTSTPVAGTTNCAWVIIWYGNLSLVNVSDTNFGGVRPVITVSKAFIS